MNTTIQMFKFENKQEIRVVQGDDGEPWFVAIDIAKALGYINPQDAIRTHCKGVSETLIPSAGGMQTGKIIAERDVYRLIMRSKMPQAERFEDWVVGDVLPSIRKTGSYSIKPMTPAEMLVAQAQMMLDHERRLAAIEDRLNSQQAERQEAEQLILALPDPTVPAASRTLRSDLNEKVRAVARARDLHYAFVWGKLYRELKYRKSFDAETRARNSKRLAIDIIEEAGLLDELYAIACEVLA